MPIDYNCIREILLFLKEHQEDAESKETFEHLSKLDLSKHAHFTNYEKEKINHCIEKMHEHGLLHCKSHKHEEDSHYVISHITKDGHEYIDSIKNESVWEKTKKILKSQGLSLTFALIQATAIELIKRGL